MEVDEIVLENQTDDWLADNRKEIQLQISVLKRQEEDLRAYLDDIDQEFKRRFAERQSEGTQTSNWTLGLKIDDHYPEVQDRQEFEEYLLKTKKLHLLQKRLSMTAIREELDALRDEKQHWLDELKDNNWDEDTCRRTLEWIHNSECDQYDYSDEEKEGIDAQFANRLRVIAATKRWKDSTQSAIDDYYRVPGVGLSQKTTITQRKR